MKKITKIIAVMLVAVMLSAFAASAVGYTPAQKAQLRFDSDGNFKIMQIADIQDGINLSPLSQKSLRAAIEAERPDLIILTGDNIIDIRSGTLGVFSDVDYTCVSGAIDDFMRIFEEYYDEYGVRVAATFGNHDGAFTAVNREMQMEIYQKYDCFIGYDEAVANIDIYGCGTYNIPIFSSDYTPVTEGELDYTQLAYNLWVIDSNDYVDVLGNEYDAVHDDQLKYIEKETIKKCIELTYEKKAVIVGTMAIDTIKKVENGKIIKTIDRNTIFQAQTPQAFEYELIKKIHTHYKNNANFTDDSSMAEAFGIDVFILEGSKNNKKITTKEDLA